MRRHRPLGPDGEMPPAESPSLPIARPDPWRLVAVWMLALLPSVITWADGPTPVVRPVEDASVQEQVEQARKLMQAGDDGAAEALLLEVLKSSEPPLRAITALAELYEGSDRLEEAIELHGHILGSIDKDNEDSKRAFARLFYGGRFPREIRLRHLAYSPIQATIESCTLSGQFHFGKADQRMLAYTTSLLFPEELAAGRVAPWVRLPAGANTHANSMYNRVCYGLLADGGSDVLRTRWMLGYPSSSVLLSQGDYSSIAPRLLHLLVRGHLYLQEYLGVDRQGSDGGPLKAFLTESGPAGAEQIGDRIFFYDVDNPRPPAELVREVFHELGHMLLPRLGPFEGDDRWASGELGERLLFQWLAEEAGTVTGGGWPSAEANAALAKLCDLDREAAQLYLMRTCRLSLDAWSAMAPEDFDAEDAAERLSGFALWVQAAHGRGFLAGIIGQFTETSPQGLMEVYKQMVADVLTQRGGLRTDAGALSLVASKLLQPPIEGAVRREFIALGENGQAVYRVYLPAGEWELLIEHDAGDAGAFGVAVDGSNVFAGNVSEPVKLPAGLGEGWHEMRLTCASVGPVQLRGFLLRAASGQAGPR